MNIQTNRLPVATLLACFVLLAAGRTFGGYEAPCHIDGCQSADGRFVITAEMTQRGKTTHGPNMWDFIWRDTAEDKTVRFAAQGVQQGQIYAQLFIAPDGETFALFNHVTLWEPEKSHMHGPKDLPHHLETEEWRMDHRFSKRVIIYRKDGTIMKEFSIHDLLLPDEWETVGRLFNRVHWLEAYDGLNFKATPRSQYAFYRVSPDYTVLELQATKPRSKRSEPPRQLRISLTDGRLISVDETLPEEKTPVRPYQGDDHLPKSDGEWKENYTPSLDPVRVAGTYRIDSADVAFPIERAPKKQPDFPYGNVELIQDGFAKADTPSWMPHATGKSESDRLLFSDLEQGVLFEYTPDGGVRQLRTDTTRGRLASDRRFYGLINGAIASWQVGQEPEVIAATTADSRKMSLNDLVVSSRGLLYFTTLKDPEMGRLTVLDLATKEIRVLFDGMDEPTLANPNGIALSRHERFLYVGISNYENRKHSGVYCFPICGDGTIDVETGQGDCATVGDLRD